MKKLLIILIGCLIISACDNGEVERLQKENESLKAQIAELSETEQNRFSKAVDLLNTANDLQSYKTAEKVFSDFIEKFPTSNYLAEARKNKQIAKNKADTIEKIANAKSEIKSLISQRKWTSATKKANSIKSLIGQDEYTSILKQIKEERYKPRKTTIDALLAEIADLHSDYIRGKDPGFQRYINLYSDGERVEFVAYSPSYGFIDTTYKYIRVYGRPGCLKGENIEVHYDKTDKVSYFFNIDPDKIPCGTAYKIVGNISVLSNGHTYFEAETIERI